MLDIGEAYCRVLGSFSIDMAKSYRSHHPSHILRLTKLGTSPLPLEYFGPCSRRSFETKAVEDEGVSAQSYFISLQATVVQLLLLAHSSPTRALILLRAIWWTAPCPELGDFVLLRAISIIIHASM